MEKFKEDKFKNDMDQMGAMIRDLAPTIIVFWKRLQEGEGMSRLEATIFVSDFFAKLLKHSA